MSELIRAVESATEDDLETVEGEIARTEARLLMLRALKGLLIVRLGPSPEVKEALGQAQAGVGLAQLRGTTEEVGGSVEQAVTAANGAAPKKVARAGKNPPGRPVADETTRDRRAIARLLHEDGPMAATTIKNRLFEGGSIDRVYRLLEHDWFALGPGGYSVTPAAKEAVG